MDEWRGSAVDADTTTWGTGHAQRCGWLRSWTTALLIVLLAGLSAPSVPKTSAAERVGSAPRGRVLAVEPAVSQHKGTPPALPAGIVAGTIGTLEASVSVSPSGEMSWSTALNVVPGIDGIEPGLTISYSGSGYGGLGVGFSLDAGGSFSRCRRTLGQDGAHGPITWTQADAYCWNGARLVVVKGVHGAAGAEYRVPTLQNVRVIGIGATTSAHSGFMVYTPDGRQTLYGVLQPQEWTLESMQWAQIDGQRVPFAWHVTQVRDQRTGNVMRYRYGGDATSEDGEISPKDHHMVSIDYGINASAGVTEPTRQVRFEYASVQDVLGVPEEGEPEAWVHQGYVAGQEYTRWRVLKRVEMRIYEAGGWTPVRRYQLGYENVPIPESFVDVEPSTSDRVRLRALQECGLPPGSNQDDGVACLWPTLFEWSAQEHSYTNLSGYGWDGAPFYPLPPAQELETAVHVRPAAQLVGDFDDDGDDDFLVMPELVNANAMPLQFWEYWQTDPEVHGPVATNVPAWSATPWTNRAGTVVPKEGSIHVRPKPDGNPWLPEPRPPEPVQSGHLRDEKAPLFAWRVNYDGTGGADVLLGEPVQELAGALIDEPNGLGSFTTVGHGAPDDPCYDNVAPYPYGPTLVACLSKLPRSKADYRAHPGFMKGLKVLRLQRSPDNTGTGAGAGDSGAGRPVAFEQISLNYPDRYPIFWLEKLDMDGDALTDLMFCKADADYAAAAGKPMPMFYPPGGEFEPVNWVSGTLHYAFNVPGKGIDLSDGGTPVTTPVSNQRVPCHAKDSYLVLDLDGDGTESLLHYAHPHVRKTTIAQIAPLVPDGDVEDPYPYSPDEATLSSYWPKLRRYVMAHKPLGETFYRAYTYRPGEGVQPQETTLMHDQFMRWHQRPGNGERRYSTHQVGSSADEDGGAPWMSWHGRITDWGDPDTLMVGHGPSEMRVDGDVNGDGLNDVLMVDLQHCYVMQQGVTEDAAPQSQAETCSFRSVTEWGQSLIEQTYEKLAVFTYLNRGDGSFELADEGTRLWDTDMGTAELANHKYVLEQIHEGVTEVGQLAIQGLDAEAIQETYLKAWTIATSATRGWRLEFANSLIGDGNGDGLADLGYLKADFTASNGSIGDSLVGTYRLKPVWRLSRHGGGLSQVETPMGLDIGKLVPESVPEHWPGFENNLSNEPTVWKTPSDAVTTVGPYEQQAHGMAGRLMQLDVKRNGQPALAFYDHVRGEFRLASPTPTDEPQPHLLTAVTDGLGSRTEVDYAPQWTLTPPSTPWSHEDSELPYPLLRRRNMAPAVARLRTDTGMDDGNAPRYATMQYQYGKSTSDVRRGIALGIERSLSSQSVTTPSGVVYRSRVARYDVTPAYDETFNAYPLAGSLLSETVLVSGGADEAVRISHTGQRHSAHAGKVEPTWRQQLDSGTATTFEVGDDVPDGAAKTLLACLVDAYDGASECILGPEASYQPLSASTTWTGYDQDGYGLVKTEIVESAGSTGVTERTYLHHDPAVLPSPQPYLLGLVQTEWVAHEPSPDAGYTLREAKNEYYSSGLLKKTTVEPGQPQYRHAQGYEYDAFGNVQTHKVYADGHPTNVMTYEYGPSGVHPTKVTNALGHSTTTQWHEGCGVPEQVTDALDHTQVTDIDVFCRVRGSQTFHGDVALTRRSLIHYDEWQPDAAEPYPDRELLVTTEIEGGAKGYTIANRVGQIQIRQAPGFGFDVYTQTHYDELGRITNVGLPTQVGDEPAGWTTTTYDAQGRVVAVTRPDDNQQTTRYERHVTTSTNEIGDSTSSEVDALGQVIKVMPPPDPEHPEQDTAMCYDYGAFGTLKEARPCTPTSAKGPTMLDYDAYGRLIRSENAQAGVRITRYDALGRMDESEDALGQITKYRYDVLGRHTERTEAYGTPDAMTATWTYDDNAPGVLTQAVNAAGTVTEEPLLDEHNRLAGTRTTIHGRVFEERLNYDAWGRVVGRTYPSLSPFAPVTTQTQYNDLDQPIGRLWQGQLLWEPIQADVFGHFTEQHFGASHVIATSSYDPLTGRLEDAKVSQRIWQTPDLYGDTLLEHFTYDWYDHGLIRMRTQEPLTPQGHVQADQFHYTPRGELRGWSTIGANQAIKHYAMAYDGFGNITASYTGNYHYKDEKLDEILDGPLGPLRYKYTGNGQVELRMHAGGTTLLSYDALNRVRRIEAPGSDQTITYNADGTKVHTYDDDSGRETFYLGAYQEDRGGDLAAKGAVIGRYAFGPAHLTRTWTEADLDHSDVLTYTLPGDHLGSTTLVTSEKGEVIDRRAYGIWGDERDPANWLAFKPAPKDDIQTPTSGYTGHHERKQFGATAPGISGLIDMHTRYYDPAAMQFLQPDTIVPDVYNPMAWNLRTYVDNSPLTFFDPDGMAKKSAEASVRDAAAEIDGENYENSTGMTSTNGGNPSTGIEQAGLLENLKAVFLVRGYQATAAQRQSAAAYKEQLRRQQLKMLKKKHEMALLNFKASGEAPPFKDFEGFVDWYYDDLSNVENRFKGRWMSDTAQEAVSTVIGAPAAAAHSKMRSFMGGKFRQRMGSNWRWPWKKKQADPKTALARAENNGTLTIVQRQDAIANLLPSRTYSLRADGQHVASFNVRRDAITVMFSSADHASVPNVRAAFGRVRSEFPGREISLEFQFSNSLRAEEFAATLQSYGNNLIPVARGSIHVSQMPDNFFSVTVTGSAGGVH